MRFEKHKRKNTEYIKLHKKIERGEETYKMLQRQLVVTVRGKCFTNFRMRVVCLPDSPCNSGAHNNLVAMDVNLFVDVIDSSSNNIPG